MIDFRTGYDCSSRLLRELIFGLFEQKAFSKFQETIDTLFPRNLFEGYGLLSVGKP
jgi:hypothetical protein